MKVSGFVLGLLSSIALLGGCCKTCPKPKAPILVSIERPCKLPPPLRLERIERIECGGERLCFDKENGAKLAMRLAAMRDWINEARKRCAQQAKDEELPPDTAPTSQPTSQPSTGQ